MAQPCSGHKKENGGPTQNVTFFFPFGCRNLAFDYKKIVDLVGG